MKEYLFCVFIFLDLGNQIVFGNYLTKNNDVINLDKNDCNQDRVNSGEAPWKPIHHNERYSDDEEENYRDKVFFPDDDDDAPSNNSPNPHNIETCLKSCNNVDTNYDPVCGTNSVTYINLNHLECAMNCGVDVRIQRLSACPGWLQTTTKPPIVTQNEALKSCLLLCPTTQEYNPVCGTDNITYYNYGRLFCAQVCGVDVQMERQSPCPKQSKSTTDPIVTTSQLKPYELSKEFLLCFQICPTTSEYDPVCGTNQKTYYNIAKLQCAKNCGIEGFKIPCLDTSPECLKRSLQVILPEFIHGIPELNITSLDPFEVDSLVLKLSGDITIEFKDAYTKGLHKCIVDYVRQMEKDKFDVQFECNLISKGKYRSSGRLFTFPINGEGQSTIKCRSLKIHCILHLSSVTKADGKNYVQIKNLKTTHSFEGRVSYNMTNLFKGNPDMSKTVLDFINKNWQIVAEEFGSPIIEFCIHSIMDNLKKLINAVPLNNLLIT
ncbi:uncharacterized protein LOC126772353 [Nymphalis io]|uniref:uncharacterized protein LOC126772353 n=1 Tax=Inachis io TaxID=171585 RepID=UPI0021680934|nr:uncharacterized protein LOC126772353 [Nymphalis io]